MKQTLLSMALTILLMASATSLRGQEQTMPDETEREGTESSVRYRGSGAPPAMPAPRQEDQPAMPGGPSQPSRETGRGNRAPQPDGPAAPGRSRQPGAGYDQPNPPSGQYDSRYSDPYAGQPGADRNGNRRYDDRNRDRDNRGYRDNRGGYYGGYYGGYAAVWVPGHWKFRPHFGDYVWVRGDYRTPPRPGMIYIPGHWERQFGYWTWVHSYWRFPAYGGGYYGPY